MTDDPSSLDNLRPEVAHSVRCVDAEPFSDGAIMHWPVVRAELRRLAADNVRLRGTPVPKVEWQELTERAERAQAELAALKARVAQSCRAYHSSFENTLDASTLYARATGVPGEQVFALVLVEE